MTEPTPAALDILRTLRQFDLTPDGRLVEVHAGRFILLRDAWDAMGGDYRADDTRSTRAQAGEVKKSPSESHTS